MKWAKMKVRLRRWLETFRKHIAAWVKSLAARMRPNGTLASARKKAAIFFAVLVIGNITIALIPGNTEDGAVIFDVGFSAAFLWLGLRRSQQSDKSKAFYVVAFPWLEPNSLLLIYFTSLLPLLLVAVWLNSDNALPLVLIFISIPLLVRFYRSGARDLRHIRLAEYEQSEWMRVELGIDGSSEPEIVKPIKRESVEDVLADLDRLVGLDEVKASVRDLVNKMNLRLKRDSLGLKELPVSSHLAFVGPPGTGKTSVARIYGRLLHAIGLLENGQVIEVARQNLVGEHIGSTAIKTDEAINRAMGGVLFIDEAYALYNDYSQDFGHEAVAVILKRMEDERESFAVIVAGYPDEMDKFIGSNPGLESRFTQRIEFPSYSVEEMLEIFKRICAGYKMEVDSEALPAVSAALEHALITADGSFGNARFVRDLYDMACSNLAGRVAAIDDPTPLELSRIVAADITPL